MQRRPLGPGAPPVSIVGYGGMPLSISGRPDEATAIRAVHAGMDAGMTFLDTANVYCLDAETGSLLWRHDSLSHIWARRW